MNPCAAPIGVFDSGVGGLSVLRHIREALPNEDMLYVADSAHAPYGTKTPEYIRARALALAQFFIEQGAKALVIACNTATAIAASELRERYALPIIGMEPAVKPAVAATRSGVIGVLATSGTLQSARYAALLENHGRGVRVVARAAHGLVECVERGETDSPYVRVLLGRYLEPMLQAGADTLVLGCTHYPFLRPAIHALVGDRMTLVDTGAAVARQVQRRLDAAGLLRRDNHPGKTRFWTSGDADSANFILGRLWGDMEIEVEPLRR